MTQALPEFDYVDTAGGLLALCKRLAAAPYIVLDTEFLRERTYRPELCLVQVKYQDVLACIDTLALSDLQPLVKLLLDTRITKVMHAGSQDLEIFYLLAKAVPRPIFDTQMAAPLLGYAEQIGYGNLVREHLGVELSKSQTRADWTRRPLPERQIAYALDDVVYLEQLYLDMRATLDKTGRTDWLNSEFAAAEQPQNYDQPAAERWKKIRNVQRYKGPALAVIQALAEWREIKARELNQPRNWLIKDDVLVTLAQQLPDNAGELAHIRSLDRKTRERFGEELLARIASARTQSPKPLPSFQKKQKLDGANQARVQLLNAWVHQRALDLNINPGILGPQAVLEKLVTSASRDALQGWRDALLGDELMGLLEGRHSLRRGNQGLEIDD